MIADPMKGARNKKKKDRRKNQKIGRKGRKLIKRKTREGRSR